MHISALQASGIQSLRDGQKVSFDTEPDRTGKGPKAINIDLRQRVHPGGPNADISADEQRRDVRRRIPERHRVGAPCHALARLTAPQSWRRTHSLSRDREDMRPSPLRTLAVCHKQLA